MQFQPTYNQPAVLIKNNENILVVADLHLGIEYEFSLKGVNVPSQTESVFENILDLCSTHSIDRLILLGDVKHTIPNASNRELSEIRYFLKRLSDTIKTIDIIPGNHDGGLKRLTQSNIIFHSSKGFIIDNFGFIHGHAWPSEEIMNCKHIFMGHNHLSVMFVGEFGKRMCEPCWLRTKVDLKKSKKRYPDANPEIVVVPSVCRFGSGSIVNLPGVKFLGPLFHNSMIDIENGAVYLLNGTFLGTVKELKAV
jgi:putative SbcD/Mre11-related phosphoesterase